LQAEGHTYFEKAGDRNPPEIFVMRTDQLSKLTTMTESEVKDLSKLIDHNKNHPQNPEKNKKISLIYIEKAREDANFTDAEITNIRKLIAPNGPTNTKVNAKWIKEADKDIGKSSGDTVLGWLDKQKDALVFERRSQGNTEQIVVSLERLVHAHTPEAYKSLQILIDHKLKNKSLGRPYNFDFTTMQLPREQKASSQIRRFGR